MNIIKFFFLTIKSTAMKKTKQQLLLVLLSLFVCNVMLLAQGKKTVTGTIRDNNGVALVGATVSEKGTSNKWVTDNSGKFTECFRWNSRPAGYVFR